MPNLCQFGQSLLAKIPDAVSDVQAAAVVLGGQTGYQMMTKDLAVQPRDTVLIQGGAGSVGFTAIQVAKWLGVQTLYTTVRGQAAAAVVQAVDPTLKSLIAKRRRCKQRYRQVWM